MRVKILDLNKLNWETIDKNHIKVEFVGHFDDNHAELERDLNKAGLHAIRRTYDKTNNKTQTVYRKAK